MVPQSMASSSGAAPGPGGVALPQTPIFPALSLRERFQPSPSAPNDADHDAALVAAAAEDEH